MSANRTDWTLVSAHEVAEVLDTGNHGLSKEKAAARLEEYGPNEVEEEPPPSSLAILLRQFRSPLIYILLVATVVTVALGEYVDSGVIAAVLVLNAAIGFFQERRAEDAIRALAGMVAPQARVRRNGHIVELDSREVVPGDLVLLESGQRVPADIRLVTATGLAIDESLLTGESTPVRKNTEPLPEPAPLADRDNMVFAGSVVTSGRASGYVVATGTRTELGEIAESMRREPEPATPLQKRMERFAHIVGIAVVVSSLLAGAIGVALGEALVDMFMVAVALAVAAVPEGLPVVFTIALAAGVRRMARRNAIIRRLPAVETLGSTTVIGSDKTGTLTENRMTVEEVFTISGKYQPDGDTDPEEDPALRLALLAGVLSNEATIRETEDGEEAVGDPTEAALLMAAAKMGLDPEPTRESYRAIDAVHFEPERRYSAAIVPWNGDQRVLVKGAPERILDMCTASQGRDGEEKLDREAVEAAAAEMAGQGLRVLAMAYGQADDLEDDPSDLVFLGLQGMRDPPREGVKEAVEGCQKAGMRVVMITGDHASTARAIADELGIGNEGSEVLAGTEIDQLDDEELRETVGKVSVFARVSPQHKLRVVKALQTLGDVVAVTGDGVNDAPALRAADIGIAMGRSGTDVAREASDTVLTDDNFVSIYAAVEEGRISFDNVRKVSFFLISSGAAMVVLILATLVLGWPLPLIPAQILWLNLVTNGLQDVALAFEPGEEGVLERPPRPSDEGVISSLLWERTLVVGLVMAAGTMYMFHWALETSGSLTQAQSVALTTLVIYMAFHVGNSRSEHRSLFLISPVSNPFLLFSVVAALGIHVAALNLSFTQFVLRVEPLVPSSWFRLVAVAFSVLVVVELHKWVRRRFPRRS